MDKLTLFLSILIIILIYVLYVYFTMKSTTLISNASLNETQSPITISSNPASTRYAYGIWIYINSWDTNKEKVIFTREGNVKLYFDKLSPVLKCDVTMTQSGVETAIVTDNFPLQKWVHIIASADNQYFDFYLDGKLVKSIRAYSENSMPKQPLKDTKLILGGSDTFDAYATRFYHWNQPIDPQTAWKTYKEGNGSSSLGASMASYGINLQVLKDNIEYTQFQLL